MSWYAKLRGFTLIVSGLCMACQIQPHSSFIQPNIKQSSVPDNASQAYDNLIFTIKTPSQTTPFKTQQLDFNRIKYLRLWVRGTDISQPVYNQEGFVAINGSPLSKLRIQKIIPGKNRVITAQGYDSQKQIVSGATLKAYYSSPTKFGSRIETTLNWQHYPTAAILEKLIEQSPQIANIIDMKELEQLIDPIIYGANPIGGKIYAIHPSRMNIQNITTQVVNQLLAKKNLSTLNTDNWLPDATQTTIVVQNGAGNSMEQAINVEIDDPASTSVTIPANSDRQNTSHLTPGNWNIKASLNGTQFFQKPVSVSQNGIFTLSEGSIANPLLIAPIINSLSSPVTSMNSTTNLLSQWSAEGDASDSKANNHGQLVNGTSFIEGIVGQAFNFNGSSDYILINDDDRHDFGSNQDFSVESWFKASLDQASWQGTIVSKLNGSFPKRDKGFSLMVRGVSDTTNVGQVGFWIGDGDGVSGSFTLYSNQRYDDNQWHYIVGTADRDGLARLYVDGQEVKNGNISAFSALDHNISESLQIGRESAVNSYYFKGSIDEVKLYDRVLSPLEISNRYLNHGLTLDGIGFDRTMSNNTIYLNGTPYVASHPSPISLTLTIPPNQIGNITVSEKTGVKTSNSKSFTRAPKLDYLVPQQGIVGQHVSLRGFGFDPIANNNTVSFNGQNATVVSATNTQIEVIVPVGTSNGPVKISNAYGSFTGPDFSLLPAGLVSWWTADDSANDLTGNNHGTYTNGATSINRQSRKLKAFNFDGSNDYIDAGNDASLHFNLGDSFSLSGWINPTSLNNTDQVIAGNARLFQAPNSRGYHMRITTANRLRFILAQAGSVYRGSDSTPLSPGWHHVVGTWNGTTALTYIDGVLNSSAVNSGSISNTTSIFNFWIGSGSVNGVDRPFKGQIDEFKVFNRALNALEVQALYNNS